jgi:hypothetical protein
MHKRASTKKEGIKGISVAIVEADTGTQIKEENPAAVAIGRLGGFKGGKTRSYKLSPAERHEIAKKAALARRENQ